MSNDLAFWLLATYLPNIRAQQFLTCLTHFNDDIAPLFQTSADVWRTIGFTDKQITYLQKPNWQAVENDLLWLSAKSHHHIITIMDENYPQLLKECPDPPLVLYVKGNAAMLNHAQIAVVGSRHPTPQGRQIASELASLLTEVGLVVTSGLAQGIDGAAHSGALNVNGLTIGVAGTGLHHIYPRAHHNLFASIIEKNGAIISEFPLDTLPLAYNFPRRNRIIAGLSYGVLVVEAKLKSGSLITARLAGEYGREVFAVPGSIYQPASRGCHYLIKQGAKLVETIEDILTEIKFTLRKVAVKNDKSSEKIEDFQPILDLIGYDITPVDVIILRSRLTTSELSSILLKLELLGQIRSVTGGYIRINTN